MFIILLLWSVLLAFITVYVINRSYLKAVRRAQETIVESLTDGIFGVDEHQKIVLFNHGLEKLTGVLAKNAIGQPVDTMLPLYDGVTTVPFAAYSQIPENSTQKLLKFHSNNNTEIPLALTLAPIDFGNVGRGFLVTLHNLSKEKQLEEMKVDFVSMAAHELRTPLTAIRGYASLLQMHYSTKLEDSAKVLLIRLIVSTTNLANLIDNLLIVSRIERNSMTLDIKPIDLSIIIKDIFESFKQQAQTRRQQYALNIPVHLPLVMADPFRIGQVFINLISNAINYTPEEGAISITVTNKNNLLEVTIKDNGEGIPEEAIPRLFTKFFRVSGSLEQGSKGTGLGLYITRSIVEMHKGKIWAESTLGKGSTFTFTLPTATQDEITNHKQNNDNAFLTVKSGQAIIVKK